MARKTLWAQVQSLLRFRDHSDTPPSEGLVIGPSQRPVPDNTQHTQDTDIHVPGGIRTRNVNPLVQNRPAIVILIPCTGLKMTT
jgi:hypothetical protein